MERLAFRGELAPTEAELPGREAVATSHRFEPAAQASGGTSHLPAPRAHEETPEFGSGPDCCRKVPRAAFDSCNSFFASLSLLYRESIKYFGWDAVSTAFGRKRRAVLPNLLPSGCARCLRRDRRAICAPVVAHLLTRARIHSLIHLLAHSLIRAAQSAQFF